ncbi:GlcG/HbpS family heme-binding protein [Neorhizobium sp. NPDC001467]|uniref:GlcG/HbpS family heme-binding protein n=1 Tax=Neorhizobium sp. NPDC001467 TaxID=3390595 RepID=UPI003CFF170B
MKITRLRSQLTYDGAALALEAAIAKAKAINAPENIAVVDSGGNLLAFARLDGARFLAQHSAYSKAQTAASLMMPTGQLGLQFGVDLALATGSRSINLPGGIPIIVDDVVIGAIGVSSGADPDDIAVAETRCWPD